ncbi:MAG: hypothetical protein JSU85_10065 [Candidatus Zixiibacteriota bacterium]|nr:MAG: hypothetical protein JSU85_10065 [candidate division Zixibacteria bacterium]
MKLSLLTCFLAGILVLANCSGDRAVVDRIISENDLVNSAELSGVPGTEDPLDNGQNAFTPPYQIMITYNILGDTCGIYCEILVCATPLDFYARHYTNPGMEVNFEVNPESLAAINNTAYTNQWGAALAKLVYPSFHTFEEIQLIVSCGPAADTVLILLPICQGELEMSADPVRLWVEQPGAYDTTTIACRLVGILGNPFGGGLIVFVPLVAGEICGPTSAYTDDQGWAYTQYRIRYEDIPNGNNDPNSIYTWVRASLFGDPDMEEEISLYCARP